jgi:uncharacterized membrane protein required for colicin V production
MQEVLTMGLDLALGAIVAVGALRGWFRGFTSQVVRLIGLVACVYVADPAREQARPYIIAKMPAIDPGLMDRILWWVAAVLSYIVLVGLITLAIQLMRTPPASDKISSRREDRTGGLVLGAAKALLIAAFLAAGVAKYGADLTRNIPWAERQTTGSYALAWTDKYQPVPRLWATPVVRNFVGQIQRNGLKRSSETKPEKQLAERDDTDSAASNRPPRLDRPPPESLSPEAWASDSDLSEEVVRDLEKIKQELRDLPAQP